VNLNLCAVLRCTDQPYIDHPLLLCRRHALAVSLNVTDRLYANALSATTTTGLDIEEAAVASPDVWKQTSHPSIVYFLTNGDRVKIGTSTNVTARVSALSLRKSNAALLLQGGNDLENALHQHFECDRIAKTEWFVLSPRIQDYIARRKASDAALRQPRLPAEGPTIPAADTPKRATMHVTISQPRTPTAEERILKVLASARSETTCHYVHRNDIGRLAEIEGSTRDNTLSRMVAEGKIYRGKERGTYTLGPEPQPGQ
jgi:hypothetical protein